MDNITINRNVIMHNRIKCNKCGDVIESKDVHDLKWCKCGTVYVDGGREYLRRGFKNSREDYTDLSETININSKGVNTKIKYKILPEEKMKKLGFRLNNNSSKQPYWYRNCMLKKPKKISKHIEISLNISLPVDYNLDEFNIAVLDEDFLQPYDYQYMLFSAAENNRPPNEIALAVRDEVEDIIADLQNAGLLSGHNRGEYI